MLWDIDSTLVTVAGVSHRLFAAGLLAIAGRELEWMPDLAGKTDSELAASVLRRHDVTLEDGMLAAFHAAMIAAIDDCADEMRARGRALDGAHEAIAALAEVPGVVQSLVTGNLRPLAHTKLTLFGLTGHLDFDIGGYGGDSANRPVLVWLARQRAAAKYKRLLPYHQIVVLGDTPHDVNAARANNAIAIGVATGRTPAADLTAAGAHAVLPSLVDTDMVLAAILRAGDPATVT